MHPTLNLENCACGTHLTWCKLPAGWQCWYVVRGESWSSARTSGPVSHWTVLWLREDANCDNRTESKHQKQESQWCIHPPMPPPNQTSKVSFSLSLSLRRCLNFYLASFFPLLFPTCQQFRSSSVKSADGWVLLLSIKKSLYIVSKILVLKCSFNRSGPIASAWSYYYSVLQAFLTHGLEPSTPIALSCEINCFCSWIYRKLSLDSPRTKNNNVTNLKQAQ